jgi:hypothetical protein
MEFQPFPKVPRLSREMIITEKLDGTNASVWVVDWATLDALRETSPQLCVDLPTYGDSFYVLAGSRKRFITPNSSSSRGDATDNFGFAAWVRDNAEELVKLGPGTHYGEWWGQGIQRGYGLSEKRFSLFNVGRWVDRHYVHEGREEMVNETATYFGGSHIPYAPSCCHVVPVLSYGDAFDTKRAELTLANLKGSGSVAAPGFANPEGIMVYHTAAKQYFKKTFEGDAAGKENSNAR